MKIFIPRLLMLCTSIIFFCLTANAQDNASDETVSVEQPAAASQGVPREQPRDESPDESSLLCARTGIGYYRWNPSPLEKHISSFKQFNQMSYDVDPIIAKQFELTSTIFFLQGGLNYITNDIREWGDISGKNSDVETQRHKSTAMRRLDMFAGIHFGNYSIKSDFSFRTYKGSMKSNGFDDGSGSISPVIYYDGARRLTLPRGSELAWNMDYQQYSIKLVTGGSRSPYSGEIGGQYVRYRAPAIYNLNVAPTEGSSDIFRPIMISSTVEQYSIIFGGHIRKFFTSNLYFDTFMPMSFGCSKFSNSFFTVGPAYPGTYTYSAMIDLSLRYVSDHARFDIGGNGNFISTYSTSFKDVSTRRDITLQTADGTEKTVAKGTKVRPSCLHDELFYGAYARVSVYF